MKIGKERTIELLDKYLAIGWSLIPINANKVPVISSWKKYQTEKMTREELIKHIEHGAGLALVCGILSNITVLDDDGLKKMGFESDLIKNVNSPIVCKTPSGGHHYYFLGNSKIRNTVNISGKAVDIRGEGGYVGIPNSAITLKNGTTGYYSWIKPPIKENIEKLKDLMDSNQIQEAIKTVRQGNSLDYKEIMGLEIGNRNNSLFRFARSLFAKGIGGKYNEKDIIMLVTGMNNGFKPPLSPQDVNMILNQAKKYHLEQIGEIIKIPRTIKEVADKRALEFDLIDIAPKTGFFKLDALIGGFIPGNLYTLTGETNSGKTTMACNFAVNVSNQNKKVLYIALESGTAITQNIASIIFKKSYKEITKETLGLLDKSNIDFFIDDDISSVQELAKIIRELEIHYDLIIVDHIGYFIHDRANYIQEQANVLKQLRGLTKEKNTAIMLIAHLRKRQNTGKNQKTSMDDIAGSSAFKQDSTDVMIIVREKDEFDIHEIAVTDKGYIYVMKTKGASTGAITLKFNDVNIGTKNALITEI